MDTALQHDYLEDLSLVSPSSYLSPLLFCHVVPLQHAVRAPPPSPCLSPNAVQFPWASPLKVTPAVAFQMGWTVKSPQEKGFLNPQSPSSINVT